MTAFLDLQSVNNEVRSDIGSAILRVARSDRYILGPELELFEHSWAKYCGVRHCVGTGNALEALHLILLAFGIGKGDEVIVPSNTYIATWLSVTHAGATPVPVEPDGVTHNIDPARIEGAITPRTRAIVVVHLYGLPCDMERIKEIARRHDLRVFEDAAQAHGATYYGVKCGALCDAAAFSFYPSKNLGALGDAGCVTTNDANIAAKIRRMRNYGGVGRVDHKVVGINSRLDEMQAAVLNVKLPHLDRWNYERRARAASYRIALQATGLGIPWEPEGYLHVYHLYVVRARDRPVLHHTLSMRDVECHVHYPVPPHLEGAYESLGHAKGRFPLAERLASEVLSLPIGYKFAVEPVASIVAEAAYTTSRKACVENERA